MGCLYIQVILTLTHVHLTPDVVLDPQIGYAALKDDYADDEELLDSLCQSKAALEMHFNQFYAGHHTSPLTNSTLHQSSTVSMSGASQPHDFTVHFQKHPQTLESEVKEFFKLLPQDFQSCNPIHWWYSNCH